MLNKHPLFWKEWKSAKWWIAIITAIFLIMFLAINNNLQHIQTRIMEDGIENVIIYTTIFARNYERGLSAVIVALIPTIILITILLFQDDKREKVGGFISSLPFKKKEHFKVKWLVGWLVITIPFVIALILSLLIRAVNWNWIQLYYSEYIYGSKIMTYDTVKSMLLVLLQTYLFCIAFYSFLMFSQTIIGRNMAASIIGSLVLASPWFIIEFGYSTLAHMVRLNFFINRSWISFYGLAYIDEISIVIDTPGGHVSSYAMSYSHSLIKIIILIVITIISVFFSIKCYEKSDNSLNGQMSMFPWVGKILVAGVTLCSALLGNNIAYSFIRQTNTIYELGTLSLSGLIGYIIISKIIKLSGGVCHD